MKNNFPFYLLIIGIFRALILFVIDKGNHLNVKGIPKNGIDSATYSQTPKHANAIMQQKNESILQQFGNNIKSPLSLLLMQII